MYIIHLIYVMPNIINIPTNSHFTTHSTENYKNVHLNIPMGTLACPSKYTQVIALLWQSYEFKIFL